MNFLRNLFAKKKPSHTVESNKNTQQSIPTNASDSRVPKARVAEAKPGEHYVLQCMDCSFTHHIPADVADQTVEFSVDVNDVRMSCVYGRGAFTVSLEVKDFFAIMPAPSGHPAGSEAGRILHASIGDNIKILHHHMLSHYSPLYLILQQSSNRTAHIYRKQPVGTTYVKFSKEHGTDIVGKIDISKAEIPGTS